MVSGVTLAIENGGSTLPAIDPNGSNVSCKKHQQYLSAVREHAKCSFAWNGLEEEEGQGTAVKLII